MREFRYTDSANNSYKFWNIEILDDERGGCRVWRYWGRVGTQGQKTYEAFSYRHMAEKFVVDQVYNKLRKGYVEKSNFDIPDDMNELLKWLET